MEVKKTKEKTRVLAHSRRQKENDTFMDIAQALPIQENAKDLDKASILRVAIHYLKLRGLIQDSNDEVEIPLDEEQVASGQLPQVEESPVSSPDESQQETSHGDLNGYGIEDILPNYSKDILQALDGFILVLSREGRVLFVSESIANYLGLRQVDVIGVHVQDIIHPQDCSEIATIFQTQGNDVDQVFDMKDPMRRKFVVRMRCAFTPSVRSITRCSNFKPIYCSCFLKFAKSGPKRGQFVGIVALCKLACITKLKEMVVGTFFKTKHSLDLSYTGIDTRIRWILGYDPSEMVGLKAYQYFHPQDLTATSSCHMNLLSRGHSHSPCYRFLSQWGDWMWVRSKSHMLFNKRTQLPEGIVIYTWIVRLEEEDERMLAIQAGESGEDKLKKYEGFVCEVVSDNGSLDVNALANPNGAPGEGYKTSNPVPIKPASKPFRSSSTQDCDTSPSTSVQLMPLSFSSSDQPTKQVSSPPQCSASMSPNSTVSDCPPNVNPFAVGGSPAYSTDSVHENHYSPQSQAIVQGAEVIDQVALCDNPQLQQSFIPSPPYTPYNNSPSHFDPKLPSNFDNSQGTYSSSYTTSGLSMPQVGLMADMFKLRDSQSPSDSSNDGGYYSSNSPPYSTAAVPNSLQFPLHSPSTAVLPEMTTHVTHFVANTPSPPVEMQTTIFMQGPLSYQPDTFGAQLQNNGSIGVESYAIPQQINPAHQKQRQTVINEVRARYAGNIPHAHTPSGHQSRRYHSNEKDASESISQWSQWLKGSAPAPVC